MPTIPTQYDFQAGASLLSLTSLTNEQLFQAISQLAPLDNIGGVVASDGDTFYPGTTANPRFKNYIWLDGNGVNETPTVKVRNPAAQVDDADAWVAISLSADAVKETHIDADAVAVYDDNTGTTKKIAVFDDASVGPGGYALRLVRVDSAGKQLECVPFNTAITALNVSNLKADGVEDQIIRIVGGIASWATLDVASDLSAGSVTAAKLALGGGSAQHILRINAGETAFEVANPSDWFDDISSAIIPPSKIAAGGAANDYILKWDGSNWVPVEAPLGFTGTADINTGKTISTAVPLTGTYAESTAHGFGSVPKLFRAVLKCIAGDRGYSINDEISIEGCFWGAAGAVTLDEIAAGQPAFSISADAANIYISSNSPFAGMKRKITNRDGSSRGDITAGSWYVKVYAWK